MTAKQFQTPATPNHALQRTPGFGVQLPSAAVVRPAQSRAVRPAMKPGTARAFASRRRAHSRAPGPESLSLGSLGVSPRLVFNESRYQVFPEAEASSRSDASFCAVSSRLAPVECSASLRSMSSSSARLSSPVIWEIAAHARVFGVSFAESQTQDETPNQALQRTGAAVTPAASAAAFPPATQRSRQPRRSLSLGSFGVATRVVFNDTFLPDLSYFMPASTYPDRKSVV